MRSLHLLLLSALSALGPTSANYFLDNGPDPSTTFTSFPPGKPTPVPEPNEPLQPGQRYADPHDNPFNQPNAFIYGPIEVVENVAENFTFPDVNQQDQCQPAEIRNFQQRWSAYQHVVFHPANKTVQHVGFAPELLKQLEADNRTVAGEVTKTQQILYGCENDGGKAGGNRTGGHNKRVILGADTRKEIFNTWLLPRSVIGMVGRGCTGTLIGPRHVLTAGHCVHTGGSGGKWLSQPNLDFTLFRRPGIDKTSSTQLSFKADHAISVKGWVDNKNSEYDYALIILQEDTSQGWMSFGWYTGLGEGWGINIDGFPADKAFGAMWHSFGYITDASNNRFDHDADTYPGNSGSGVYVFIPASNFMRIYGVHTGAYDYFSVSFPDIWNSHTVTTNVATRINQVRFKLICSWMASPQVC